ncbi:MAG TPA: phosphotransferase family protein [Acidimicrobiales bacterium]|nr:phosphotransferase family protein [Acidimicrobiales bacterium]
MSDVDADALGQWLRANVGVDGPLTHEVISGGASNLTIGVTVGGTELVVRRPPVGAFLPSANDVSREYRYLSALRAVPEVPVPEVLAFCDDPSVIGAPFYVMRRLHGLVPHDPSVLAHLTRDEARAVSERFVDVLKAIHEVDVDAVGLGGAAKRSGYLERQVARWTDQWHRAKESDSPVIDELSERLTSSIPVSGPATIVHGDYRLGNVMVSPGPPYDLIGVFDWEMATLGDPLADVGYTLLWWGTDDRPAFNPSQQVADLPGMLSAPEVCERYGADPDVVRFHVVLAAFKLAIIGEGNRARARRLGAAVPDGGVGALAEWALGLLTARL